MLSGDTRRHRISQHPDASQRASSWSRTILRARAVVITGGEDAAMTARELQADGYLVKPFELEELFALVERYSPTSG
jgi:DNA-binding response OmpR family regulator